MLPVIKSTEVMKRLHEKIEQHNSNCPLVTHERKLPDGKTLTVTRRQGIIREQVITTFHALLSEYIHSYNRTASIMPAGMYTQDDPPSLTTNCVRLAQSCKATDRTVRNHIRTLTKLGLVTTKWHGSKKNFELWISGEMLYGNDGLETAKTAEKTAFSPSNVKIFPHNHSHGDYLEKENKKADMLVIDTERTTTERAVGQNTGKVDRAASTTPSEDILGTTDKNGGRRVPNLPEGLKALHARFLMQFWIYAWKVLYPTREFSIEQQEKALSTIYEGVYGCFADEKSDDQWIQFHTYQLEKLDKAGKYFDYHPDKYPGDPYGVFVKGKGYFSSENTTGFQGIDAWMKREKVQKLINKAAYQDKKEKLENRLHGLLRQARRDFEKFHSGKLGRKEVRHLSEIGLFQYHHAFFKGFGQKWADLFCRQWQSQKTNNFQPPAYYQSHRKRKNAGEKIAEVVIVESWMEGDGIGYWKN